MSSRSSRSSTSSSTSPLGKRTRQQRDTSPTPMSSTSTLSPRRTPTRSNKSYELSSPSSIEKPSKKKIKLDNVKVVASKSTKSVRKGKENIAPGDKKELESEDDTMDVDIIVKEEILDGRDENFNEAEAAATLPTPKSTPVKSKLSIKTEQEEDATKPSRQINNIFSHAHSLLSTTATTTSSQPFIGRESQQKALLLFLSRRFPEVYITRETPSEEDEDIIIPSPSLYVSGPPGLGKTALLNSVLGEFQSLVNEEDLGKEVRVHMENCSSLGSIGVQKGIWERLGRGLGMKIGSVQGQAGFENGLKSGGKFLLILDEIDHILSPSSSSRDLLNTLFALAHSPSSSLTLIGIANALDLTSRALHLPTFNLPTSSKGKSKLISLGPQLLPFPPYDFKTIESIIKQRLGRLNSTYPFSVEEESLVGNEDGLPLVSPMALTFCAKKVAAGTGDIRTALQVVRNAIGIVENEERSRLNLPTSTSNDIDEVEEESLPSPLSTPTKKRPIKEQSKKINPLSTLTALTARKVSMSEMLLSLRLSGLTTPNPLASRLSSLPFNTRNILVGIAVSLSRESTPTTPTFSSVASINKGKPTTPTKKNTNAGPISVRLNATYEIYSAVLKKEGTLHKPLSKNEFTSALDILESSALITLDTFASSSPLNKSKSKSLASKKSGGAGGAISSDPIISLNPIISLVDLISALKEIPAKNCEIEEERGICRDNSITISTGAMQETLRISRTILRMEEDRVGRVLIGLKGNQKSNVDEMAPREGFHGNGLGNEEGKWLGEKRRKLEH